MIAASLRPAAARAAGLADRRHREEGRAPCAVQAGGRRVPRSSDVSVPAPAAAPRRQHSRRGPPPARAEGGAAQTAAALLQTAQTVPDQVVWHQATVVENREASADGSVRTLLLSVEDHVNFLEGRKVRHVQENRRWIDDYRVPGQFVAARYCADGTSTEGCAAGSLRVAQRLLCLASSPYEARRDSAMLDASLVELLISRNGDGDERVLAELGPGAMIDVSRVAGDGFASLFNPKDINLMACLEGGHPLLVVAAGVRGIAPVRAALSWTPVLAHAGSCRVAVFFLTESQASAPYLVEWDTWREAGAQVHPLYVAEAAAAVGSNGGAAGGSAEAVLERELFGGEGGLAGVLGGAHAAKEAAVLFSGLGGELAASLQRRLTQQGVASERILVCDL